MLVCYTIAVRPLAPRPAPPRPLAALAPSSALRALVALGALSLVALSFVALSACEPRVEEPVPPPRAEPRPTDAPAPSAPAPRPRPDASTIEPPLSPSGRCVKHLPAAPARAPRVGPDPACPADPEPGRAALPSGKARFVEAEVTITLEVAKRDHERQRGLMYRRSLPDEQGMLFVFDDYRAHPFWMHDTCISLDMIWLDRDGFIVGIEESTRTMDDSTYDVGCASAYVIETAGGWSRRHGVRPGQKVELSL
jgi:uncharacterized membrane protein (UPF0127 family)